MNKYTVRLSQTVIEEAQVIVEAANEEVAMIMAVQMAADDYTNTIAWHFEQAFGEIEAISAEVMS